MRLSGVRRVHRLVGPVGRIGDVGEALVGGEGAARIDHGDGEAALRGERHQRLGDMHRADHDQPQRRVVGVQEPVGAVELDGAALVAQRLARAARAQRRRAPPGPGSSSCRRRAGGSPAPTGRLASLAPPASAAEQCPASRQLLHEHLHLAAAGQPDFPGALVGDAEIQQLRRAGRDRLLRRIGDRALDAAAATPSRPCLPDLVTAIWLPAGRGELPQVSVTVASATCSPAARQPAAVASTSSASCNRS